MNRQSTEAAVSLLAAFLVLISSMLDPRVSAALAVIFLTAFSLYLWRGKRST